jgi:hypothetical protein
MTDPHRYFLVLIVATVFAGCSFSQSDPPKSLTTTEPTKVAIENGRFHSEDGRFSVAISEMPSMTMDVGSEKAKSRGIDAGKQYAWRFEKTLFTVMYTPPVDPDGNRFPNVLDDLVSGSRKGALRQNVKILSEKPFKHGDFEGVELRYVSAQGVTFINRLFIAGSFGYQVVGGYVDDNENVVLEVLNSFQLSSKP